MRSIKSMLPILLALGLAGGGHALADPPQSSPAPNEAGHPSAASQPPPLAEWDRQLDADDYGVRESASQRLAEAGKPAVPGLAQPHGGKPGGVRGAIQILRRLLGSKDMATGPRPGRHWKGLRLANGPRPLTAPRRRWHPSPT